MTRNRKSKQAARSSMQDSGSAYNSARRSVAPTCSHGGCNNPTNDPSGKCHHHRTSAPTASSMNSVPTLPTLAGDDPHYNDVPWPEYIQQRVSVPVEADSGNGEAVFTGITINDDNSIYASVKLSMNDFRGSRSVYRADITTSSVDVEDGIPYYSHPESSLGSLEEEEAMTVYDDLLNSVMKEGDSNGVDPLDAARDDLDDLYDEINGVSFEMSEGDTIGIVQDRIEKHLPNLNKEQRIELIDEHWPGQPPVIDGEGMPEQNEGRAVTPSVPKKS